MEQLMTRAAGLVPGPAGWVDLVLAAIIVVALGARFRGTRAARPAAAVAAVALGAFGAAVVGLPIVATVAGAAALCLLVALSVAHAAELRSVVDRSARPRGGERGIAAPTGDAMTVGEIVARAAGAIAADGLGALIVIERRAPLDGTIATGLAVDAELSADLLRAIFAPRSPLHDGAAIIRGGRLAAAGALLPNADPVPGGERVGTRHRAALGITAQTDALAVIVSEERGELALAEGGQGLRRLDATSLARELAERRADALEPPSGQPATQGGA